MRVAIYGRVSTKDRGQEVENQLAQLREFAAKQGWTVYREYVDHETGARAKGRTGICSREGRPAWPPPRAHRR